MKKKIFIFITFLNSLVEKSSALTLCSSRPVTTSLRPTHSVLTDFGSNPFWKINIKVYSFDLIFMCHEIIMIFTCTVNHYSVFLWHDWYHRPLWHELWLIEPLQVFSFYKIRKKSIIKKNIKLIHQTNIIYQACDQADRKDRTNRW